MKVLLLSAVFQNRKVVLKFYEPKSNKLILVEDNTDYHASCYVLPSDSGKIREWQGIESIEMVEIFDVVHDKMREMAKVTVTNPMLKYELNESGQCWEGDIKYYQDFIYDNKYKIGTWYDINETKITPEISETSSFDLSNIDMDSVVNTSAFSNQVTNWANLLSQPIPNIKRLAFDIEVESSTDGIPDVAKANQRVTAISFCSSDGVKTVFTLRRPEIPMGEEDIDKEYQLVWYENEKDLLEDAFKLIDKYPLILTYNGDMFDMPYLYNRCTVLGIQYNPFKMMHRKATLLNSIHIDLYGIFSNRSLKLYAFNGKYVENGLDPVSKAMLGEGKTEYEGELDVIPLNLLSKYCYNDSRLTYELSHFNNDLVMNLLIIMSRVSNLPIDDISRLAISHWIKSMLYSTHRENNQLIPRSVDFPRVKASTTADIKDKKYQGAIVIEPVKGVHFDVTVLDFASLYPSIIKTRNISYETVCCPHEECKSNTIPYTEHWSCTKKIGIVSLLIGSLKELRVNHFKVLAKKSDSEDVRDFNDTIAQALKVFLNASYGVIGFEQFSLYFLPTAEAVTAIGRDIISQTIEASKSKFLPVLYGDTDSIFVLKPTPEQIQYLIDFTREHYAIDLEVDKEYKYLVLSDRKKNYFGVKKDNSLDIKGLAGKKSNTPPYLRKLFNEILDRLKQIEIPNDFPPAKDEIEGKIRDVVQNFDDIPLKELALKVLINKEPSEYKVIPQVLKAAKQLNTKPEKGQFITFIKTWNKPNVKPLELAKPSDVDKPKYMENFESVLEQIMEPMDISMDSLMGKGKQTNLLDW